MCIVFRSEIHSLAIQLIKYVILLQSSFEKCVLVIVLYYVLVIGLIKRSKKDLYHSKVSCDYIKLKDLEENVKKREN